ncbi:DUF2182 domain-containing protein [Prauserella muralis]|uniref:Metal-binding protein n=1 Tax=Prauserella muralis TaxID=588067 RepID=A0A2V4B0J4_9PSEU|nr:DUF2182 domain-containing protein [Prauserella muralis]PXY26898.1 metal-binding protein [Prauserella muralis]TWE23496.1 putative metal-binding membrane protein [Prauserella muralis]
MTSPPARHGPAPGLWRLRRWSRAELLLAAVLAGSAGVAWLLTSRLAMPDMRVGILTGGPGMDGMDGAMRPWPAEAALFLGVWVVMMAAMMLPSIVPFTAYLTRLLRARGAPTHGLLAGYFLVWTGVGVVAFGLVRVAEALVSPGVTAVRVGAVVVLAAGLYQFTPLKRVCLRHCRSPAALALAHGEAATRGRWGALRAGIGHGGYCAGCCWGLMALLLAVGMMNLAWMAAFAVVIALEKVSRRGEAISRVLGVLLTVAAAVLLVQPSLLAG